MTIEIIPFAFGDNLVRVIERDDEPWFVLADACRVLEIANVGDVAARLDNDEKGKVANPDVTSAGGNPNITIINESGLYSLIFTSRKEAAKQFRKWVTAEVLPAIRKTGRYEAAAVAQPAAGEVPAILTVPLKEWSTVMSRLIEVQEDLIANLQRNNTAKDMTRHEATAKLLIRETALTDDEIAERMKGMMGWYLPEWVAWQRRKVSEAASPS